MSITFLVANTLSEFSIDFVSAQDTESVQPVSSQELDQLTNLYLAAVFAGETRKATRILSVLKRRGSSARGAIDPETGLALIRDGSMIRAQAAGDGFAYPWGVWASYTNSDLKNNFAATAFKSDTDTVFFVADFSPWDTSLFGVAVGYSDTEMDTFFNTGQRNSEGFSIIPYFGFLIDDVGIDVDLSADFSVGYVSLDISQVRTNGVGARVTSSTDQDVVFISGNLNASRDVGDLLLGGRVGVLWGVSETDGFTESDGTVVPNNRVSSGLLGLEANASYLWGDFEPFARITYEIDLSHDNVLTPGAANDTNDILVGLGVNWYLNDGVSAGVSYERSLDRDDFEADSITIQLRADF